MALELDKLLLVGDNPFHGISHLSEDRARARGNDISHSDYAAKLVLNSIDNGANGFMFSVSDTTLQILEKISDVKRSLTLYAIVPYAYEYVRIATQIGTVGLARKLGKQVALSGNFRAVAAGIKAVTSMNPEDLMKTYVYYELSRIESSIGKRQHLSSLLLHEVITDMIVALNLDRFVKSYVRFVLNLGIKPGFETRNFAYLVNKFKEWNVDLSEISIVAPFNKVGFQMNPSREQCEKALLEIPECTLVAMSTLAAGYLKLPEAVNYIDNLPNIRGVVIGVSKEKHACETFRFMRENLKTGTQKIR